MHRCMLYVCIAGDTDDHTIAVNCDLRLVFCNMFGAVPFSLSCVVRLLATMPSGLVATYAATLPEFPPLDGLILSSPSLLVHPDLDGCVGGVLSSVPFGIGANLTLTSIGVFPTPSRDPFPPPSPPPSLYIKMDMLINDQSTAHD